MCNWQPRIGEKTEKGLKIIIEKTIVEHFPNFGERYAIIDSRS